MFNIFDLSIIYIFFINIIFTTLLSLLKSTETGANLSTSNLFTLLFKLFKPVGTFSNLQISYLSTSYFKLAKSVILANSDVSQPVAFFESAFFLHN